MDESCCHYHYEIALAACVTNNRIGREHARGNPLAPGHRPGGGAAPRGACHAPRPVEARRLETPGGRVIDPAPETSIYDRSSGKVRTRRAGPRGEAAWRADSGRADVASLVRRRGEERVLGATVIRGGRWFPKFP